VSSCVVPAEFARHSLALCENRRSLHFRLEHRQHKKNLPICISCRLLVSSARQPPSPHHKSPQRQGDAWRRKRGSISLPAGGSRFPGVGSVTPTYDRSARHPPSFTRHTLLKERAHCPGFRRGPCHTTASWSHLSQLAPFLAPSDTQPTQPSPAKSQRQQSVPLPFPGVSPLRFAIHAPDIGHHTGRSHFLSPPPWPQLPLLPGRRP
jgi:hypothetical protein